MLKVGASELCRVVGLLPRQAIKVRFVPKRAIIRFGHLESHLAVRHVGTINGAIEPAKCVCHGACRYVVRVFMRKMKIRTYAATTKAIFARKNLVMRSSRPTSWLRSACSETFSSSFLR
jgi:hypothetical protein